MFPTEYQRHCVSTSTLPYLVMIWVMALAVLSSLLSFFLPGAIVVYLYTKIFKKLRNHQLFMFGQTVHKHADKRQSLPRVIIEEVSFSIGFSFSASSKKIGNCEFVVENYCLILMMKKVSLSQHQRLSS
uniref:Uncharacterized protein n=1 Tax=Angiostrongylus cantonensis TaxID=6313 RepID=A0A0K0CY68_ANGCA